MNNEEKEAIEKTLKETIKGYESYYKACPKDIIKISEDYKNCKTVLNYIEKLQKENEELKEELDYYKEKEKQEFDERDYYED